jgi:hypothetical protein
LRLQSRGPTRGPTSPYHVSSDHVRSILHGFVSVWTSNGASPQPDESVFAPRSRRWCFHGGAGAKSSSPGARDESSRSNVSSRRPPTAALRTVAGSFMNLLLGGDGLCRPWWSDRRPQDKRRATRLGGPHDLTHSQRLSQTLGHEADIPCHRPSASCPDPVVTGGGLWFGCHEVRSSRSMGRGPRTTTPTKPAAASIGGGLVGVNAHRRTSVPGLSALSLRIAALRGPRPFTRSGG